MTLAPAGPPQPQQLQPQSHGQKRPADAAIAHGDTSITASWASCPHAQDEIRKQIRSHIPHIEHLEVEDVHVHDLGGDASTSPGCSATSSRSSSPSSSANPGARLRVEVVSAAFESLKPVDRQRLVHAALREELASGAIHALPELTTLTPSQWYGREAKRRIRRFEDRVREAVPGVEHLDLVDLTDGHAVQGFYDGSRRSLDPRGLELKVTVVSTAFEGMKPLARQQLVQDALGPEILSGAIHALPHLRTWTPSQYRAALAKEGGAKAAVGCAKL